jgi:serine/threonine-protein kinase
MQQPGVIGTRVDRYQVERLLGAGGFGSVYLARHVHTDGTVALKLLKRSLGADQQMLERFLREARAAASVGSEHIVRVMDAGLAADGQAFLALEFLDGLDLKELAAQHGPLPHLRLVMVVLQALEALSAAHAKGIVHRDMKPANVFVVRRRDERGTERDFVKLLDFGISKMHGDAGTSGLTMTGVAMGTPSYMAPEQFFDARSVDARADIYSVSAMLYELLSGQLPFDAESYAHLIVKVRTEQPSPLNQIAPNVPLPLAQVVMVGLAKEPHQRWQSAQEFGDALRSAMGLPPPGSTPAFLPSQSGSQPAFIPADGPGLEKTHTPAPRPSSPQASPQPQAQGAWVVPSSGSANTGVPVTPAQQQSLPPAQSGWVVPSTGAANTGVPVTPQAQQSFPPAQSGWVVPSTGAANTGLPVAQSPLMVSQPPVQRQATQPPAPQQGSSALKWVAIVIGAMFLLGGCCTCGVIMKAASSGGDSAPPIEVPANVPVPPEPEVAPEEPEVIPEDVVDPDAVDPDAVEPDVEPAPPPRRAPPPRPTRRPKQG